ncbi:MAG: GAF domain-containing protein [Anaerolineales bacterium]|jgi:GAF domain-containing protein
MTLPIEENSLKRRSIFKNLVNRLFSPHPSIVDIGKRRRAQLTAILSFILSVSLGVGLIFGPNAIATFITLLIIALLSYSLSRTKYYLVSAFLLSFGVLVNAFLPLYLGTASNFYTSVYTIAPLAFILASALLPPSGQVAITIAGVFGTALSPFYSDMIPPESVTSTTGVLLSFGLILIGFGRFRSNTEKIRLEEIQNANQELEYIKNSLEERVVERTKELEFRSNDLLKANQRNEQRAKQFEAISLVSAAISSFRSLENVLPKVTEHISQHFGFYQVGIFLNDINNDYAILSAANSDGGKRMISRGHQLKIGEQGIVGFAISTGKPRIALDVGDDAVYFGNPELPDTRSEMAIPLKIGEAVVGALDVQSTEPSAFGEEDISVLSLLADQVSMAIENARLFDQARKSLAESEALYRQYLRQAWQRLPKEQNLAGFRYNFRGASPIEEKGEENINNTDEKTKEEINSPQISIPIAIRGETIGTLAVQIPETSVINDDQIDLINAVAERVALSAENARLFEETTRRAERERLVSDITVKIRSTNDPDTMIDTALEELKQALGATKVQLVPHKLQRTESNQQLVEPTPPSNGQSTSESNKN